MTGADEIINKYFAAGDRLGHILVKTESMLEEPQLPELEKEVFTYLDVVLKLALLNPNSKAKDINDHKPGQETLAVFEDIAPRIDNLYIRAFFLDILQVNKRNKFVHAKLAIQTYWLICESCETLSDKRDYYIRVLRILVGLGKGRKQTAEFYFGVIKNAVLAADMGKDCYSVTKLTEEMIPIQEDPDQYLPLLDKIKAAVQPFLESREFRHYRECNHVLALLLPDDSVAYGTEVARSYIMDVDDWDSRTNALQYLVAEGYKKGLRVFQNLGIKNQETESYRQKLVVILKKAAAQQQLIGALPPVPLAQLEFEMPEFESFIQGVYWVISWELPPKSAFLSDLESKKKEYFHLKHMGSTMTDASGNTVDVSPDNAKLIYKDAALTREVICKKILKPSFDKFSEKFSISETEVYWLISESSFIPEERKDIYAHGLYHGFCGNFAVAVHLLLPQIENGLKVLLEGHDKITHKIIEEIQTANGLTTYFNHLQDVLHEDLIFDLEGLLNESFGENIRNLVAHGLYSTGRFFMHPGFYTWWIALKLALHLERYLVSSRPEGDDQVTAL
jgi:hypothetical protein